MKHRPVRAFLLKTGENGGRRPQLSFNLAERYPDYGLVDENAESNA